MNDGWHRVLEGGLVRYRTKIAMRMLLLVLAVLVTSCTKSGQIPYGDLLEAGEDTVAPNTDTATDAGTSTPDTETGTVNTDTGTPDTATPDTGTGTVDTGTSVTPETPAPKGSLMVGCRGLMEPREGAPRPLFPGDSVNSVLTAFRGGAVMADSTDILEKAEVLAGAVSSPPPNGWFSLLGNDVAVSTGTGQVLASYSENAWRYIIDTQEQSRGEYRLYDETLQNFTQIQPKAAYFSDRARQLSVFQDVDGDKYRDLVAITKAEPGLSTNYYLEAFFGSAQGVATKAKWQSPVPVVPNMFSPTKLPFRPLEIAASSSGQIGVAYKGSVAGKILVYVDLYSSTGQGVSKVLTVQGLTGSLSAVRSCGMALFESNQQLAVALCLQPDDTVPGKVVVAALQSKPTIDFASVPSVKPLPVRFRVLDGNILRLAMGSVAAFAPAVVATGKWNTPLWVLSFESKEEPLDVIREDVDGDGQIETLVETRIWVKNGMAPRYFKFFRDINDADPYRMVMFDTCEEPQNG